MSLLEKTDELDDFGIEDKMLKVEEGASMRKMLIEEGADPDAAGAIQSALVANFAFDFRAGQNLRLGLAPDFSTPAPSAPSASASTRRAAATWRRSRSPTTARYVAAQEPALDADILAAAVEEPEAAPAGVPADAA